MCFYTKYMPIYAIVFFFNLSIQINKNFNNEFLKVLHPTNYARIHYVVCN